MDGKQCLGAAALERSESVLDREMLERTIELAELGRCAARPNPVVGAVLATADGVILSTGHHPRRGQAHAERLCLDDFREQVPDDATLYVSLEPCDHQGMQPPCSEYIIERGVKRVVYASCDSNPETAGMGTARLAKAGVKVERAPHDIERMALQQNAGFHSYHLRGRPYVTAKFAMTSNGRFATGDPNKRWISSEESRSFVHYLRAGSGAVATGVGTVLADDPQLTVRGALEARTPVQPVRVIYDRDLRVPLSSHLVQTVESAPVLLVTNEGADITKEEALIDKGVSVYRVPSDNRINSSDFLTKSLTFLADKYRINDMLLEAGPVLLDAFFQHGLIDQAIAFIATFDAPKDQPGLELNHPLVELMLKSSAQLSGLDVRHNAVINPVWDMPGSSV